MTPERLFAKIAAEIGTRDNLREYARIEMSPGTYATLVTMPRKGGVDPMQWSPGSGIPPALLSIPIHTISGKPDGWYRLVPVNPPLPPWIPVNEDGIHASGWRIKWYQHPELVIVGVFPLCVACGAREPYAVAAYVIDPDAPPEPVFDWPFEEDDCPVCWARRCHSADVDRMVERHREEVDRARAAGHDKGRRRNLP